MTDRAGSWMQTYTGKQFWPIDPRPEDVFIEDIAHALSMMCRFNGHCLRFYSVAEHSVILSNHVSEENALWALLHDASEAYIADIVRPAKRFISGYKETETRIMKAVCERFELSLEMPEEVHIVDMKITGDEQAALMIPTEHNWDLKYENLGCVIEGWYPDLAKEKFLNRYFEIIG